MTYLYVSINQLKLGPPPPSLYVLAPRSKKKVRGLFAGACDRLCPAMNSARKRGSMYFLLRRVCEGPFRFEEPTKKLRTRHIIMFESRLSSSASQTAYGCLSVPTRGSSGTLAKTLLVHVSLYSWYENTSSFQNSVRCQSGLRVTQQG